MWHDCNEQMPYAERVVPVQESHVSDILISLLGGERFEGDVSPGKDWSPNLYKSIAIHDEVVIVESHVPLYNGSRFELQPCTGTASSLEDLVSVFNKRSLLALEGLYISESRGGIELAKAVADEAGLVNKHSRFHEVGVVTGFTGDALVIGETYDFSDSVGWESRLGLSPEHYECDAEGGKLWSAIDSRSHASAEGRGTDSPAEDSRSHVFDYYNDYVNGTIELFLREYSKMFASGYEVITPAGILLQNEKGYGVVASLENSRLSIPTRVDRNIQMLYRELKSKLGLTVVPVRSNEEIAQVIVTRRDFAGNRYDGNLYFPYKMLEFAYGQKRVPSNGGERSLTVYEGHSSRSSWESYSQDEVSQSLRDVMLESIYRALDSKGLADEPESMSANAYADEVIQNFTDAFLTCILVSKYDVAQGSIVALKVRILTTDSALKDAGNILLSVLESSRGSLSGNKKAQIYRPINTESFYEYYIELDSNLANAEPKFAYKALESVMRTGGKITYDNAILGLDSNDRVLKNGGQIDLLKKLSHLVCAGSRAGKGVWTFSILAAAVLSKRPIFYLDNKPDMASLFLNYGPAGFAINGANITHDPSGGTDYFSKFTDADSWLRSENIPPYVAEMFGGMGYRDLGGLIYLKALTMMVGVLAARVDAPASKEKLGGDGGIVLVIDELANANANLMSILGKMRKHMANEGYASKLRDQLETGESKRIDADKPRPEDYWFTSFYRMMQESLEKIQSLSNAGLKNSEASISDIFILTQEPPEMVTSLGEVTDLFVKPNKNSMGTAKALDNPKILPSFGLVGGTDVFIGYDRDNRAFLNQGNPSSKASEWLNPINRGFGYIKSYTPITRERFNTSSLAEEAIYYKPFLLFADGNQDAYFVKNALSYAEEAGIDNPESIISRNSVEGDPTTINPAVGFMGYLNMAGLSDADVTEVLNESGKIAQNVADALGYPGTWRDLLMDFRPEYMFSVDDIVKAFKSNEKLVDTATSRMPDFYLVYPECFTVAGGTDSVSADYGSSDYDDFSMADYGTADDTDEWGQEYESEVYVDQTPLSQPQAIEGTVIDSDPNGKDYYVYDGVLGAEDVNYVTNNPSPVSEPAIPYPVEPQSFYTGESVIPPVNQDEIATEDLSATELQVDWSNDSGNAMDYIKSRINSGYISISDSVKRVGRGYYTSPDGRADNYYPSKGHVDVESPDDFKFDTQKSIEDLVNEVTMGAFSLIGGVSELRSIRVIDGMLIVNNVAYRPKFSQQYLGSLPRDLRYEVNSGNVARLFNWRTLKGTAGLNIRRIAFDDINFVSDYVSDGLGWGGRVSVHDFYREFTRLNSLTIGNSVFMRDNWKYEVTTRGEFYQPTKMRAISDSLDHVLSSGTLGSWNYTRTTLSRRDISFGMKALGVAAGITATAAVGTAAATSKTGRGIFSGLQSAKHALKGILDDTK